jgi:hypothetical protein
MCKYFLRYPYILRYSHESALFKYRKEYCKNNSDLPIGSLISQIKSNQINQIETNQIEPNQTNQIEPNQTNQIEPNRIK